MINEITVEHNSSDVQYLQWVQGLTNYHTDLEARTVTVISGEGWQFQYKDEDPVDMTEGLVIEIPANKAHKIIKGTTDLVVSIEIKE